MSKIERYNFKISYLDQHREPILRGDNDPNGEYVKYEDIKQYLPKPTCRDCKYDVCFPRYDGCDDFECYYFKTNKFPFWASPIKKPRIDPTEAVNCTCFEEKE